MVISEILANIEIALIYGLVSLGVFLTFRVINFSDLTCDGSFLLGVAVYGASISNDINPIISLIFSFLCGLMTGTFTGILAVYYNINELLSSIIVAFMMYTIGMRIMGGVPNISILEYPSIFDKFSNPIVPLSIIVISITLLLVYTFRTDFGLTIRSLYFNKKLLKRLGLDSKKLSLFTVVISNGLISFAGGLLAQYQKFSDISQGNGSLIIGLAAILIGESLFHTKNVSVLLFSCIVGSIAYRMIIMIALQIDYLNLETYDINFVTGGIIIGVLLMRKWKNSYNSKIKI